MGISSNQLFYGLLIAPQFGHLIRVSLYVDGSNPLTNIVLHCPQIKLTSVGPTNGAILDRIFWDVTLVSATMLPFLYCIINLASPFIIC